MAPERLGAWLDGFVARHGASRVQPGPRTMLVTTADGATADVQLAAPLPAGDGDPLTGLLRQVALPRSFGLLVVRRGGYGVAVVDGAVTRASKIGRRHVQGRTAAGGWSQQRFARRRDGQTRVAASAAADHAAALLLPAVHDLAELVTGGDQAMVTEVLADPRLAPLRPLLAPRLLAVGDPDRRALDAAIVAARAVRIRVREPAPLTGE